MGVDLKTAVESGRRWRHRAWKEWIGPGAVNPNNDDSVLVKQAISSDFEIEPEPEKPREYWICEEAGLICTCGKRGPHIRVHDADACDRLHNRQDGYAAKSRL